MTGDQSILSDDEILELVVSMTESRPGLATVRDAALALTSGASVPPAPDIAPGDAGMANTTGGPVVDPGFTDRGVPTFDAVRERIEGRSGKAAGAAELDSESAAGAAEAERFAARGEAGKKRLDDIRKSMQQRP